MKTKKNNKVFARISKQFIMDQQDIKFLNELPANLPETKLTAKQKDTVNGLYYKYIGSKGVVKGWGGELYKIEQKEAWPCDGQRVKQHEAMRMILGWLVVDNTYHMELTAEKAAEFFFRELTCREADQILKSKIYEFVK